MAFSTETKDAITAVAIRAKSMWTGAKQAVGFGWETLISLLLSFLMEACKPKTEETRARLIKSNAKKCMDNGVKGCIEACVSGPRARKMRQKMAKRLKLKTKEAQDAHYFNASVAALAEMDTAVAAMTLAYDGDETEDEE
jgi:hypothetical protein